MNTVLSYTASLQSEQITPNDTGLVYIKDTVDEPVYIEDPVEPLPMD